MTALQFSSFWKSQWQCSCSILSLNNVPCKLQYCLIHYGWLRDLVCIWETLFLFIWRVAKIGYCVQIILSTVLFVVLNCNLVASVSKRMIMIAAVVMKRKNQRVPFLGSIKKIPNKEKSWKRGPVPRLQKMMKILLWMKVLTETSTQLKINRWGRYVNIQIAA